MFVLHWFYSIGFDGYSLSSFVLQAIGSYFYIRDLKRGKNDGRWVTVLIWALIETALIVALYLKEGKVNGQVLAGAGCSWLILRYTFKYGERALELTDKICLISGLLGVVLSFVMRDPLWMILIALGVILFGGIPTLKSVWQKPRKQSHVGWMFFAMSGVPIFWSLSEYTVLNTLQPVTYTFTNLGVLVIAFCRWPIVREEEVGPVEATVAV